MLWSYILHTVATLLVTGHYYWVAYDSSEGSFILISNKFLPSYHQCSVRINMQAIRSKQLRNIYLLRSQSRVTVKDNLFRHEFRVRKSPALPTSVPGLLRRPFWPYLWPWPTWTRPWRSEEPHTHTHIQYIRVGRDDISQCLYTRPPCQGLGSF
jgi:hypothetical protein